MRDRETIRAVYDFHRRLGYPRRTALRLARWCVDESQPAPGWTHKETSHVR